MVTARDIRKRIQTQPFVPLRIVTSSGETFDVSDPELLLPRRRRERIEGKGSVTSPSYTGSSNVEIMHVTGLLDLPTPPRPGSNGKQASAG
jgi:hypothetical protein